MAAGIGSRSPGDDSAHDTFGDTFTNDATDDFVDDFGDGFADDFVRAWMPAPGTHVAEPFWSPARMPSWAPAWAQERIAAWGSALSSRGNDSGAGRISLARLAPVLAKAALILGVGALLLAPTAWVALSLAHPANTSGVAGPSQRGGFGQFAPPAGTGARGSGGGFGDGAQVNAALVSYLEAHRGATRYLLATQSAMTAAPFILQTGQPVMAIGGFSGGDPILTPASLAALVAKNDVRYFLISGNGRGFSLAQLPPDLRAILESGEFGGFGGFGNSGSSGSVTSWITSNCALVPASAYGGTGASGGGRAGGQLYDCGSKIATNAAG